MVMWTRGPSTIFTGIGDVDTRSFCRHSRDTGFPCLLGYNKQERLPVVDNFNYKHFTYSLKSTIDKQSKQVFYEKFLETFIAKQASSL